MEGGRKGEREGVRKGEREGGREGVRKGEREGGRESGREGPKQMVQSQLILSTLYMHCHGHLLTVHAHVPQSSTNREPANANRRQLFQPIWPSV